MQQYRPQALNDEPRDFWRAPGMPELETLIAGPEVAKAPGSEFWVTGACKDRGISLSSRSVRSWCTLRSLVSRSGAVDTFD